MTRSLACPLLVALLILVGVFCSTQLLALNQFSLASTDSASMDSKISIVSVSTSSNSSNPSANAGIPNALSIQTTQNMTITSNSVRSVIVAIVDESHEPPKSSQKHISEHNSYFLPTNLIVPQGVDLSFLDTDAPWDTPHPHSIAIINISSGQIVSTTGKLDYTNNSKPLGLPVGKYIMTDTKYPWLRGTITVSPSQITSPNADVIIGGFYTTTNKALNNKDNDGGVHSGWLGYYRTELPRNGFKILSEYNFHYAKCKYCPGGYWPDLKSADHTLFVYSTTQPFSQALSKLAKMVWNNVYI